MESMGLSSAVNWWEESQLRVLVLSSLAIQYLLAIFAGGRRFSVPRWYRFFIWICYLGSDAVAIYALATLFNRQRRLGYKFTQGNNRDLEVLWAPILLVHLGGQVFITAYDLEDNELWSRHIVTTISQVTVAVYVFWKSWSPSADRKLLGTSVILFILGIAKCIEKSVSLRGATFKKLAKDSSPAQSTPTKNREEEVEDYVRKAREFILADDHPSPSKNEIKKIMTMRKLVVPDKLFIDAAYPFPDRMDILKSFSVLDNESAYRLLRDGLSNIFSILYTKIEAYTDDGDFSKNSQMFFIALWMVTIVLSVVAIILFHVSQKHLYPRSDVIVSVMLLYGTFVLDLFSYWAIFILFSFAEDHIDLVAQHSIIRFLSREERHKQFMKPCNSSKEITNVVRQYVTNGWKEFITDAESYHKFNDRRGHWKLEREGFGELEWSLEKPFDESVLLWHLATDFCWHDIADDEKHTCYDDGRRCRHISDYMMHLLFANPEMLMMGSRRNLFKTACDQIEHLLGSDGRKLSSPETELRGEIMNTVKGREKTGSGFIHDAWMLAQGLKVHSAGDEKKIWTVIEGVWVEMLCFSASRCRGYLHAKNLSSGVEYLSYVWLLLSHSGMETLPERLQRTHKSQMSRKKMKHPINDSGEDHRSNTTFSASQDITVDPISSQRDDHPSASHVMEIPSEEEHPYT